MIQARMIDRKTIAEQTALVTFGFDEQEFHFIAGQYVRITLPTIITDNQREKWRDFSIASSPNNKRAISIAFRSSQSMFKQALIQSPMGLLVTIEEPFGYFILPGDVSLPIVFIAGGIGITPFFSMASFATEEKLQYKILILYGNHTAESGVFLEALTELSRQNPNLSFSNHIGHIDAEFIKSAIQNPKEQLWYIAGPPGMVFSSRQAVLAVGGIEERIKTEEFTGYD